MENKTKKLFLDMDGTVARFHDEVKYLERMWEKKFFYDLVPFENVVDSIKILATKGVDIYILSSVVNSATCVEEKREWLNKFMPFIPIEKMIFVPSGVSKAGCGILVNSDTVLLDDYNRNLEEWKEAGGYAVKMINNINNKGLVGPKWTGTSVRYDKTAEEIASELLAVLSSAS